MNNDWSSISDFLSILEDEEISLGSRKDKIVSIMYAFYRYYNGDIGRFDKLIKHIKRSDKMVTQLYL